MAKPTSITDNTGATANSTLENVPAATAAVTDTSAASLTSVNAALTALENNVADLAAKVNAVLASPATFGTPGDPTANDAATGA